MKKKKAKYDKNPKNPVSAKISSKSLWTKYGTTQLNIFSESYLIDIILQLPIPEPKKEVANDKKEKTRGKTVQEIDRERLEQKFSKDKKETLNQYE